MNVPEDAQYEWYYKAYAPLDTPASMASPADHTTSIQTYFENCVDYLFGWLVSAGDEEGIHHQIAYYESCLGRLLSVRCKHFIIQYRGIANKIQCMGHPAPHGG
jgi:hypothetical protein